MNYSKKNAFKIIAASICTIVLIIVMVCTSVSPNKLLGSVYNINDVEKNINKIKIGDSINYDINGNSEWKVIYIDKENNTIDVVSKKNVADITLSNKEDFENALTTFQTEANKYVDGKYAIKARSVNRSDLEYFGFEGQFWTADNYNGAIAFTNGKIEYIDPEKQNDDYYILPYVQYRVNDSYRYNVGDEYEAEINGVSKWFVISVYTDCLYLMPKDPIKVNVVGNANFIDCPSCYIENLYQQFRNQENVLDADNLLQRCVGSCCESGCINDFEPMRNYYKSKNIGYKIMRGGLSRSDGDGYKGVWIDISKYQLDSYRLECCYGEQFRVYSPVTKGFRPVVTLKFGNNVVGKDSEDNLNVGDNVKYNALEYQNWKVLSINKDNNTVDLISGGIVKNLLLQGQDDFDNYEDILQTEVDKYKTGDNVIKARAVEYSDLANLNKINDRVNARYWINSKRQFNKKSVDETSSPYSGEAYFNVGIMYYDMTNLEIEKKWVPLYIVPAINNNNSFQFSAYNGTGELSFTAGIRPIITVKLSSVKKVDENTKNEIINNTKELEKNISKEQETNNYYYVTDYDSNGDDKLADNKDAKKGITNNYYNEDDDNEEGDKLIKYVLIGLILLNVSIIAQVVLSAIIFKKIKK